MSQRAYYKKLEIICDIMELATNNVEQLHVFVDFSAHINEFSVWVTRADTVYTNEVTLERLMKCDVYLHKKDALKELKRIKENLIKLVEKAKAERKEVA